MPDPDNVEPELNRMTELKDALMIELAYCRHADLPVSETADRIAAMMTRKHDYWQPGDPACPRELKCSNGELHTLRCKACGDESMARFCLPEPRP